MNELAEVNDLSTIQISKKKGGFTSIGPAKKIVTVTTQEKIQKESQYVHENKK